MGLSTCRQCGGHIPLGPDATNQCERCGAGVFVAAAPIQQANADGVPAACEPTNDQLQDENKRLRALVGKIADLYRAHVDEAQGALQVGFHLPMGDDHCIEVPLGVLRDCAAIAPNAERHSEITS